MEWFKGGVGEAIAEAKAKQAVFVVVVKGQPEEEATKALDDILQDQEIVARLSNMVCIEVINGSTTCTQFSAIYPVVLVPSIFFIDSSTGVDLEITGGILSREGVIQSIDRTMEKLKGVAEDSKTEIVSVTAATQSPAASSSIESADVTAASQPSPIPSSSTETSPIQEESVSESAGVSVSLQERVEKAKRLAAQRQAEREAAEKEKEKSAEMERRKLGKEMNELKSKQEEQELKEAALNRKKDKEEEKKAREAVKAAIEQDRLARKMKYDSEKKDAEERKKEIERKNLEAAAAQADASAAARASVARLQFRLPNGMNQTRQFPADAPLSEVYSYVATEVVDGNFGKFSLSTTFPRIALDQEEKTKSLKELKMAPSATVLILPSGGLSTQDGGLLSLLWLILTPFTFLWAMLTNLFSGSGESNQANPPTRNRPSGGIGRISNVRDDNDENNTWNGNSTQQM